MKFLRGPWDWNSLQVSSAWENLRPSAVFGSPHSSNCEPAKEISTSYVQSCHKR